AKARVLMQRGRYDESLAEIGIALRLDPDSFDANSAAGRWHYLQRRFVEAIAYYEKATGLIETEYMASGIVVSCYNAIGDREGARRAARRALERTEKIVAL